MKTTHYLTPMCLYLAVLGLSGTIACGPEPIVGPGAQSNQTSQPDQGERDSNSTTFIPGGGGNPIPWPDMSGRTDMGTPDMALAPPDMPRTFDSGNAQDQGVTIVPDMAGPADMSAPPDMNTPDMAEPPDMAPDLPVLPPAPECGPTPIAELQNVSVNDLVNSYSPAVWESTLLELMSRRYPEGYNLLISGRGQSPGYDCVLQYEDFMDTSSIQRLSLELGITLRSCGYEFNIWNASASTHELYRYGATTQGVEIATLAVGTNWPPRGAVLPYLPQSFSQNVSVLNHLTREADKQASMSFIFAEMNLYLEELTSAYVLRDIVTMDIAYGKRETVYMHQLWTLIYLYHIRTTQPSVYAQLTGDINWRTHILWLWSRAEYVLQESSTVQSLGTGAEGPIISEMNDPRWSQEIQALRTTHGCP